MRTTNSIKNIFYNILLNSMTILIGLVAQSIFIRTLGSEYNGLKSLFTSIISMLSISELGFGIAIIYNLYKPVASHDTEKIKTLVKYYQKIYRFIALVILIIGLCLLPFIPLFVGKISIDVHLQLVFLLFLSDAIVSYLMTYKRSIIQADQKEYLISKINILYLFLVNFVQIIILLLTKNFIYYLLIRVLFRFIENMTINHVANKKYPYLKEKNIEPLEEELKKNIHQKVKGLLFHKIGDYIVSGTDSIIISVTLGLGQLGLYNNYYFITNYVNILFGQIFSSVTSSVGNLIVEDKPKKTLQIYKTMLFANTWIYCFCSICIFVLIEPFITIWIGKEYLLSTGVLLALVINFYFQGLRKTDTTFKEAAGIFFEDRYISIVEAIINIVFSLLFVHFFGLAGVLMGTICSTMVLFLYSFPKYIFKSLFSKGYIDYFKIHVFNLLKAIFIFLISVTILSLIPYTNVFLKLLINAILCLFIPNFLYILLSHKSVEFSFLKKMVKELWKKKKDNKNG